MKKKHALKQSASQIETIRDKTSYGGARTCFGLPFYILAGALWISAAIGFAVGMARDDGGLFLALAFSAGPLIAGSFCASVPALASAVFDMADCALGADVRENHRDAIAAHQEFQRNEELLNSGI